MTAFLASTAACRTSKVYQERRLSFACGACRRTTLLEKEDYERIVRAGLRPWCLHCGHPWTTETDLGYWRRTGRTEPGIIEQPMSDRHQHRCPWCDAMFRTEAGLNLHLRDRHKEAYNLLDKEAGREPCCLDRAPYQGH